MHGDKKKPINRKHINIFLTALVGQSSQGRTPTRPRDKRDKIALTVEFNRKKARLSRGRSRFVPGRGPVCPRDGSCLSWIPSHPQCLCLLVFSCPNATRDRWATNQGCPAKILYVYCFFFPDWKRKCHDGSHQHCSCILARACYTYSFYLTHFKVLVWSVACVGDTFLRTVLLRIAPRPQWSHGMKRKCNSKSKRQGPWFFCHWRSRDCNAEGRAEQSNDSTHQKGSETVVKPFSLLLVLGVLNPCLGSETIGSRKGTQPAKSKRGREEGDGTENVINCRDVCRKLSWRILRRLMTIYGVLWRCTSMKNKETEIVRKCRKLS